MPRATKEVKNDNEVKEKKSTTVTKKRSTSASKKTTTSKTETKTKTVATKPITKKAESKEKKPAAKSTTTKSKPTSETIKSSTSKKEATTTAKKKTTTQKTSATSQKKATSTAKKRTSSQSKKLDSNIVAEYYDLPYRYNETIVKILYQTPTILFVYWDISDTDRESFIKEYGENFFNNTRPILKIFNLTKNYNFEVEINDFANSWYINVDDANCEYKVELARKTIKYEENLKTNYVHISSSNDIEFPNDHILLEQLPDVVKFKNVQTNQVTTKNIGTLHLVGINKIYKVHDFYKKFYKDEILEEINSNTVINLSSSSWS